MNRVTSMFREPRAWLAVLGLGLGLAGCNQLEKLDGTDTAGASGMPPEVRAAFEESCGKSGCHVAGGTAPALAGGSLDELVGTKYVTIGDIPNSYIAVKMLPDATLEALGLKHHQDSVVHQDSPSLRGMIKRVRHLIEVTPVKE